MALDSKLTQNINLRANGDQLLKPLEAFGREINKTIAGLGKLSDTMTAGGHKSEDSLRKQVQLLQRLVGEASTLQNVLSSAGRAKGNKLLDGLDDQALGRKAAAAARISQALDSTGKASDALSVRLTQLNSKFAALNDAGRKVTTRDLNKAYNTENAIKQVRRLEQELERLDARNANAGTGQSSDALKLRADIQKAQDALLQRVQNPNRSTWTTEITQIGTLTERYRQLTKAEADAAIAAGRNEAAVRRSVQSNANMSDAMLRAQLERGANQYRYTTDQARGFDMVALGRGIDANVSKLGRLREMMGSALAQDRPQKVIDRLNQSWQRLTSNVSEAIAQQKAFNNLPEQRMKSITSMLFSDGGLALGGRMLGAAVLSQGVFAAINALQGGVKYVVDFEDALKGLQAIAGATDTEMKGLSETIVSVSQNTKFSALEITKAATQIAQAGYSAQEMSTVLKDALTLASASGSSPTEAVDTLTSTLGAFQLQASESTHVVDVLVQGLNRSKLSINQMQAAIQYAGATAHESGVNFEELTTIAASLANAGIRSGSTIGTGLRQLLVDLKTPTENFKKELKDVGLSLADVDVKSKGVAEVVRTLAKAGFTAEAAYSSFEVRAASSFLAFKGQIEEFDDLQRAIGESGAAARANEVAMDSLSAKWQKFLNLVGSLGTDLAGPFVNALKTALDGVSAVVGVIGALTGSFADATSGVGVFGRAVQDGLAVGLTIGLINPIAGAIAGLAAFIGSLRSTHDEMDKLTAATNEADAKLSAQKQTVKSVDEAIDELINRNSILKANTAALTTETITLADRFSGLSANLGGVAKSYDDLLQSMLNYRAQALKQTASDAETKGIAAQEERDALIKRLQQNGVSMQGMGHGATYADANVNSAFQIAGKIDLSTDAVINAQSVLNRLKMEKGQNKSLQDLIKLLSERVDLLKQAAAKNQDVLNAKRTVDLFNAKSSTAGQAREQMVVSARTDVTNGLDANQREAGSGDTQLLQTKARVGRQLTDLRKQLAGAQQGTAAFLDISGTIDQLTGELARVTRADRVAKEERDKDHPDAADKGTNKPAAEVAAELKKAFPGIVISFARQRMPGDAGYVPGSLHTKPGGNAIDVTKLPQGVTPDNVRAFIERLGLEVPKGPNGFLDEFKNPSKQATGGHYHFGWTAKRSSAQRAEDSETERLRKQQEQDEESLRKARASSAVGTQTKTISAIINEAKAGSAPIFDLKNQLDAAFVAYRDAALKQFDVEHPTEGLTAAGEDLRKGARGELEEKIKADLRNWYAEFYRQIADAASKDLDRVWKEAERVYDQGVRSANLPVKRAQQRQNTAGSELNRSRVGAGAQYRLQREAREAELARDRTQVSLLGQKGVTQAVGLMSATDAVAGLPEGEDKAAQLEKIREKQEELNKTLQEQRDLQQSINERTLAFTAIPLGDRLKDAVAAWADNSGAMDSWGKTLENNVGPALDMFTDQLATMFTKIAEGTATVKQALTGFIKAFAQFVVQIIAKALALMAVKAILGAFGLQLESGPGGTTIGKKPAPGQITGGPAGEPRKFITGGYNNFVSQGVSNRDSVDAKLAQGEYVVRSRAVESLGLPFMDAINQHGAKGLDKVQGSAFTNIQAPRQETNVWVVKESERPQMGKNDILLVLQDDILQGGATKKLIRQVAQGG